MLIKPDCIPCILTMSVKAIQKLSLDSESEKKLFSEILTLPGLRGLDWNQTSPEIIENVMEKIIQTVQDPDPFQKEKDELNRRVMKILPFAEKLVHSARDPVYTAARLAILGNSIDFMMPGGTAGLEAFISERVEAPLSADVFKAFTRQLGQSRQLLYLGDNCGEIVLDKLFIRTLTSHYKMDIVFVTRSTPTLNDATRKEAMDIGLDEVATVIDNGMDGPLPGTVINRCSSRVKDLVNRSDLIISKGGGNFDSLEQDVHELKTPVTFMLLSKCRPINQYFNTELYQPILANFYKT